MEGQLAKIAGYIADLTRSVGFLSRLPVPPRFFEGHDGSLTRTVRAFPAAGALIALPAAVLLLLLLACRADPLLAGFMALAATTLLTGALHEDGLADTADGLGGGRDRDHMLAIMKDSRTGSYGVVALILSFGLRAAAVAALAGTGSVLLPALALAAAAAVSRGVMVAHWHALAPARANGVAVGAGRPQDGARTFALASASVIALVLLLPVTSLAVIFCGLVPAGLAGYGFTRHVDRKLGGHTGDTIGATQQIVEIVFLAALALIA